MDDDQQANDDFQEPEGDDIPVSTPPLPQDDDVPAGPPTDVPGSTFPIDHPTNDYDKDEQEAYDEENTEASDIDAQPEDNPADNAL